MTGEASVGTMLRKQRSNDSVVCIISTVLIFFSKGIVQVRSTDHSSALFSKVRIGARYLFFDGWRDSHQEACI